MKPDAPLTRTVLVTRPYYPRWRCPLLPAAMGSDTILEPTDRRSLQVGVLELVGPPLPQHVHQRPGNLMHGIDDKGYGATIPAERSMSAAHRPGMCSMAMTAAATSSSVSMRCS